MTNLETKASSGNILYYDNDQDNNNNNNNNNNNDDDYDNDNNKNIDHHHMHSKRNIQALAKWSISEAL